jgi:predicted DCC family thiol-disulfide oxidoreductase YuxK
VGAAGRAAGLELTVWFDGDCGLCTRIAAWVRRQPKWVPVHCVAAQTAAARGCPLDPRSLLDQVTVTASDGAVYRGSNAWIVVLWALRGYRGWALRFATPRWRPFAERLFATIAGFAAWTRRRRPGRLRA